MVGWVRPRVEGVAALVGRGGSVAGPGEGFDLGVPQIPGDSEAVQHEYEQAVGGAGDRYVEHQAGGGFYDLRGDHWGPGAGGGEGGDETIDLGVGQREGDARGGLECLHNRGADLRRHEAALTKTDRLPTIGAMIRS